MNCQTNVSGVARSVITHATAAQTRAAKDEAFRGYQQKHVGDKLDKAEKKCEYESAQAVVKQLGKAGKTAENALGTSFKHAKRAVTDLNSAPKILSAVMDSAETFAKPLMEESDNLFSAAIQAGTELWTIGAKQSEAQSKKEIEAHRILAKQDKRMAQHKKQWKEHREQALFDQQTLEGKVAKAESQYKIIFEEYNEALRKVDRLRKENQQSSELPTAECARNELQEKVRRALSKLNKKKQKFAISIKL